METSSWYLWLKLLNAMPVFRVCIFYLWNMTQDPRIKKGYFRLKSYESKSIGKTWVMYKTNRKILSIVPNLHTNCHSKT